MPRNVEKAKDAAPPGRPRSAAVDQAVLRAAFSLFIERGLAGASIEQIAERAGVARTSIYRRWANRDALLAEAIEAARNEFASDYSLDVVERASPVDFVQLLLGVGDLMARPDVRRLVTRLIGTIPDNPGLIKVYRETYFAPRRRAMVEALRRVQAAGALPPDADIEVLADMLGGALMHRLLFELGTNDANEDVPAYVRRLTKALGFDFAALGLTAGDRSDELQDRTQHTGKSAPTAS
jgi:AcrR family transcriptional regulator